MMGAPVPALGYASRTEAVMALRGQFSYAELAAKLGITPKKVRDLEASGMRQGMRRAAQAKGREGRVYHVPDKTLRGLARAAAARGIAPWTLASRILDAAIEADLIDAILDDRDGQP